MTSPSGEVISADDTVSILVADEVLPDGVLASKLHCTIAGTKFHGIGMRLGERLTLVLLGLNTPIRFNRGQIVKLCDLVCMRSRISTESVRKKLHSLLNGAPIYASSERDLKHAVMFVLEAKDPAVRNMRAEALSVFTRQRPRKPMHEEA